MYNIGSFTARNTVTPYRSNNVEFTLSKNFICIIDICLHQHGGPFPCVHIRCMSVCVKKWLVSYLL